MQHRGLTITIRSYGDDFKISVRSRDRTLSVGTPAYVIDSRMILLWFSTGAKPPVPVNPKPKKVVEFPPVETPDVEGAKNVSVIGLGRARTEAIKTRLMCVTIEQLCQVTPMKFTNACGLSKGSLRTVNEYLKSRGLPELRDPPRLKVIP